jgi:hypothetical protein
LLGHFIADYPAQTDWLFERKLAGWPGLLMHGGAVLVAQASATFPHLLRLAPLLLGMASIHVIQDFVKIRYGHYLSKKYPVIPYVVDQLLHVALIITISPRMIRIVGEQSPAVRWAGVIGAALIVLTWTYYITWRVVVGQEDPYPPAWRWTGKLERALALFAGLLNVIWLAPLAAIPRLLVARSRGVSLTGERNLLLDAVLGIVLSAITGYLIVRFISF